MIEKKFEISKHFLPSGDQPNAINNLVKGLEEEKILKFFLVLLAQVKLSQSPMSLIKFKNLQLS